MLKKIFLIGLYCILMTGLAYSQQGQDLPKPGPNETLIVVNRPSQLMDGIIMTDVVVINGKHMFRLRNGQQGYAIVPKGKHQMYIFDYFLSYKENHIYNKDMDSEIIEFTSVGGDTFIFDVYPVVSGNPNRFWIRRRE